MVKRFNFERTALEGLYLISPFFADDERGCFVKDYSEETFRENGIELPLREVFYTYSKKGVVRAIHFQEEKEQAKLVRVISGRIFDVAVDLRPALPTFGKWLGFELSGDDMRQLYIPRGFGHGYLVLEESVVSYKCDEKFYPEHDSGIMWNDPDISVKWPLERIGSGIILSEKDTKLMSFAEFKEKKSHAR